MNILIINHYAGSPSYGMEYRPYHFAREWIKAGHKVTIASASFSHLRLTQPKCVKKNTIEFIDDIQYVWFKTPKYHRNDSKRVINMLFFVCQLLIKNIPIDDIDVVIDSSTYPLTIYGSHRIAKRFNARLVFEVHDLWPLTPMELGGYSIWHPFILLMQWVENYAYKKAHRVVSLLPKAKQHMISHGMSPEKFVYIPNGTDISSWQISNFLPEEHAKLLKRLNDSGKFIIGYAGGHSISNALKYFIEAAAILKKQDNIHFVLVGQGPEKESLLLFAKTEKLNNVSFLSPIPRTSVPTILDNMNAVYIGWNRNPLYRFGVSPNKLIDYMMAKRPVIHSIEAGNDLVAESGCGISVPPEDPKAIAEAIVRLAEMSEQERTEMGKKGHDYVKSHHDYAVLAKRFLEGL